MSNRKIILRFDDICETMNWEQWNKAKELLDNISVKALLGVIPNCKDDELSIDSPRKDFWNYISYLQKDGYTIAMHGLYHVFDIEAKGIVTKRKRSEFAGHSYEEQYKKIKKGKEIFLSHGIETDVFFAPAHSYDDNTLRALRDNGFKYISDGMSSKPYMRHGIVCLPCRNTGVPKIMSKGVYTVVLHAHEWVRRDKSKSWDDLRMICTNYKNDIVSFDEIKSCKLGKEQVQRIIEKSFFVWAVYLRPILSHYKQKLTK